MFRERALSYAINSINITKKEKANKNPCTTPKTN